MRKLSKLELNALDSLNKIAIQEKNNEELSRLRNERIIDRIILKSIFLGILIICYCAAGYWYYLTNKKQTYYQVDIIKPSHSSQYKNRINPVKKAYRKNHVARHTKSVRRVPNKNGKLYYWTDEKGTIHATNTGVPSNVTKVNTINEINTFNKRTIVRIIENNVYIPVILNNNGVTIRTEMLLDTGCSSTVINSRLARKLKLKKLHNITSTVADGSTVYGSEAKLNFIKVGPYSEQNVYISYQKHAGSANKGLLGMDFLMKHPFHIDYQNKAVIWE